MKNKVSLANAGYALFLLFFALEPLLGKCDAYWYALCGLAVVLGVVLGGHRVHLQTQGVYGRLHGCN